VDRLEQLRVFVKVAEEAGFASAGRRLGLSPAAVTRAVAGLEGRIGARLLHRTTRLVRLTEAGARFLDDSKRILAELEEAEGAAAGAHATPRGPLAVTASLMFGRMFVAPVVLAYLAQHPLVQVRMLLYDRVLDLVEEGLDVAVRIARLKDSSLAATRVGMVRRVVCASPAFLAKHGVPRRPSDLADFKVVTFAPARERELWSFGGRGRKRVVSLPSPLVVNSAEVAIAAAVAGHGLTQVLSYQIGPELRAGRLALVLQGFEAPPIPVNVIHAEGRRASARVRSFVDFAVERLRAALA